MLVNNSRGSVHGKWNSRFIIITWATRISSQNVLFLFPSINLTKCLGIISDRRLKFVIKLIFVDSRVKINFCPVGRCARDHYYYYRIETSRVYMAYNSVSVPRNAPTPEEESFIKWQQHQQQTRKTALGVNVRYVQ